MPTPKSTKQIGFQFTDHAEADEVRTLMQRAKEIVREEMQRNVGMTPKVSNNRVLLTAMRVFVRNLEENARGRFIAESTEDFR